MPSAGRVPPPGSPAELSSQALAGLRSKTGYKNLRARNGRRDFGCEFQYFCYLEHISLQKRKNWEGKRVFLLASNLCRAFFLPYLRATQ